MSFRSCETEEAQKSAGSTVCQRGWYIGLGVWWQRYRKGFVAERRKRDF